MTMTRLSARTAWLPAATGLLGAAWGSNQFTPMLLVYHRTLGLRTGTLEALFGAYAIGLIPGLLVGGRLSDTRGRRAIVMPAALLSLAGSVVLAGAGDTVGLLFAGRLLAGLSSGAMFGAGTAWLRELSARSGEHATHAAARRAVVAMTAGFAFGPLVAGVLAQWAPHAGVIPYVPHIALAVAVIALLRDAPETVVARPAAATAAALPQRGRARFRRVVVPSAPWVFAAPAIAFALLPAVVGADHAADGTAFVAAVTALTAFAGVLVQPLARRLEHRAGVAGLVVLAAGLGLAAVTAETQLLWLLVPCAIVLGCAYGLCLVAGLVEVQRIASGHDLARLTAVFYAFTYIGFAAPYLLALGAQVAGYALLFGITAALALATAALVAPRPGATPA
ncbi:MAG TPA: MFS transporter [Gaiellales bacterium]|nr:MFS transporter [Gaiellales bacterium]